eukprot:TRINITY_DN22166_c0_g1_i1.p1 TRINITY_DN22166_c0_g1~~TRINITY_DN22166_c0_g1_i1.p1  ORF type:complete len:748 (+),score=237.82 TRINITY_DN22166_c0_g1_i1:96-2339(+)
MTMLTRGQAGALLGVVLLVQLLYLRPWARHLPRRSATDVALEEASGALLHLKRPIIDQTHVEEDLLRELRKLSRLLEGSGARAPKPGASNLFKHLAGVRHNYTDDEPGDCAFCRLGVSGRRCRVPTSTVLAAEHARATYCGAGARCLLATDLHTLEATDSEGCMPIADIDNPEHRARTADSPAVCGTRTRFDRCLCGPARIDVPCGEGGRVREASCDHICQWALAPHPQKAKLSREPPKELAEGLFETFAFRSEQEGMNAGGVHHYEPPPYEHVKGYYEGVGVTMFSGGERFVMVFLNALYIRIVLGSTIPIQLWRQLGEGDPTPEMLELSTQYSIEHCRVTASNGGLQHFNWQDRWTKPSSDGGRHNVLTEHMLPVAFKPVPPLLSRFETVIWFDDDALPIEDPIGLLRLRASANIRNIGHPARGAAKHGGAEEGSAGSGDADADEKNQQHEAATGSEAGDAADEPMPPDATVGTNQHIFELRGNYAPDGGKPEEYSAVFYRDIWTMWHDADIWNYIRWPSHFRHYPAQDSGVFIVSKAANAGDGFRGLATAAYMSAHHKIYYPAIYESVDKGLEAIGTGDKDVFQVAFLAKEIPFRMMGPMFFVGKRRVNCGHSMGQPDETGQLSVIHMNGLKYTYKNYQAGHFDDRKGFASRVAHLSQNKTPSVHIPNSCDGVTKSTVYWDTKKQKEPETMCARFQRNRSSRARPHHIDWDFEDMFLAHLQRVYSAPYVQQFVENVRADAAEAA